VSVLTSTNQHFVACVGTSLASTPRELSFCQHAVADGEPMIVGDARQD
jgi:hypothetical protein